MRISDWSSDVCSSDLMDSIRDQIQETSKRIKRLGESSQEIGSIVELINDISEQTNILALNAAIQAASPGEAGRRFGVVADEVQPLAERASNADKLTETPVPATPNRTSAGLGKAWYVRVITGRPRYNKKKKN